MADLTSGNERYTSFSYFDGIPAIPADAAVTMAYVPFQLDTSRYCDEEALKNGTLYTALNKPFLRGALK
ncbi:MAG: spore coat associated protein CotJA [Clostridia bacterium]|nr:spore coat associated protein CotJA [Clostridia bacterium]